MIKNKIINIFTRFGLIGVMAMPYLAIIVPISVQASVVIGTDNFTSGWATFGQAVPQGQAFNGLQVSTFSTQTDVKNRWNDGSIKFAVVTANIPSSGTYAISSSVVNSGTFSPAIPSASVTFTISGVVYTATLPSTTSSDVWLAGPMVREWRSVVTPMNGSNPHPLLRVYFDTRVYNDGKARVDVDVENSLDINTGADVHYDVNILINGSSVLSQVNVTHYYLMRWRRTFDTNSLMESVTTPDFAPFVNAGVIPQFDPELVNNTTFSMSGTYSANWGSPNGDGGTGPYDTFGLLGKGGASSHNMWDPGGRQELGTYPDWIAQYIIYKTANQRIYTMRSGEQAGAWPIHIRETNGNIISVDSRPGFWLDDRCPKSDFNCPQGNLNFDGPQRNFNNSHTISLAYVPYLITGDRYFIDEVKFWANASVFIVWPNCGPNYTFARNNGVIMECEGAPRGLGWAMRNIVDAAAMTSDSDPTKTYFTNLANNNLVAMDKFSNGLITRSGHYVNPLGTTFEYYGPNNGTGTYGSTSQPQWQNNYLAWALDHALALGFTSGAATRNRIVNFQLKLFNSEPDYPRAYAAPYYPVTGLYQSDLKTINWFTSLKQLYDWNVNPLNYNGLGTADRFSGYYGTDARIALITAMQLNLPGAQASYDWLTARLGRNSDWNGRWSIAPSYDLSKRPTPAIYADSTTAPSSGYPMQLSWSSVNATNISISPGVGTVSTKWGMIYVRPVATTTYTITASNPTGTSSDSITIIVPGTSPAPSPGPSPVPSPTPAPTPVPPPPPSVPLETKFNLKGESSEVASLTNNAQVNPSLGPTGTLVVNGTGAVNFAPVQFGNGVSFGNGGQQNSNSSFYRFTGSGLSNIFDSNAGEISFYIKSKYSLAERTALGSAGNYRSVFDVADSTGSLYNFVTYTSGGGIAFNFEAGERSGHYYIVPSGTEDTLFGKNVVMKVKLTWNGTAESLYLNDVLKQTYTRAAASSNWGSTSTFYFGTQNGYGGGFWTNDDYTDEFVVMGPSATGSQPILGDINSDHIVNSIDYSILNSKWFTTDTASDLNKDGLVNAIDFSILNANWFKTW